MKVANSWSTIYLFIWAKVSLCSASWPVLLNGIGWPWTQRHIPAWLPSTGIKDLCLMSCSILRNKVYWYFLLNLFKCWPSTWKAKKQEFRSCDATVEITHGTSQAVSKRKSTTLSPSLQILTQGKHINHSMMGRVQNMFNGINMYFCQLKYIKEKKNTKTSKKKKTC